MESTLLSPWLVAFLALMAALISVTTHRKRRDGTKKLPPHAAGGWPLIGHLPMMTGPDPLHITLSGMADEYGPVFTVKLGSRLGLVANTLEAAAECLKANDVAFSNRQRTAAMRLMGYDFAMFGFSNYGGYWREMRKISVARLLSARKVAAMAGTRRFHVRAMVERCRSDRRVDMRRVFGDLTLSLMVRTVAGDVEAEMEEEGRERWRRSVRDFFKMMTVFTVSDVVPWLRWVDGFGGWRRAFEKTGREFDGMLQRWVEEHKGRRRTEEEEEDDADFMTVMLGVSDAVAEEFPRYDADTITKATCLVIIPLVSTYKSRLTIFFF